MENENYELLIDRKIYDDLPDELKYDGFTFYKKEGVSVFGDYEGEIINKIYDSPGEGKVWVEDEYILDVKEV